MDAKEANLAAGWQCHSAAITTPDHARGGPAASLKMQLEIPTGLVTLSQSLRLGSVDFPSTALDETDNRSCTPAAAFSEGPQHRVSKRTVSAPWPSAFVCTTQPNVHQQNNVYTTVYS